MSNGVEIVGDGEGLAVIGAAAAVEQFFRTAGLLTRSVDLGLDRLGEILGRGATVVQGLAEMSASSGRYLKIDAESADLIKKIGLIETGTPGLSWAMIGKPGDIASWITVETGFSSFLTNPAVLGNVAGMMAQAATQQQMAEISAALARLEEKVDTILKNLDDAVLGDLVGVGAALDLELRFRNETLRVSDSGWAAVSQSLQKVEAARTIALARLQGVIDRWTKLADAGSLWWQGFEKATTLAKKLQTEEANCRNWLAVLVRCAELDHKFFVLRLERALAEDPEQIEGCRRAVAEHRTERDTVLATATSKVSERLDAAAQNANSWMVMNQSRSRAVIKSAKLVAADLDRFHQLLGIKHEERSWKTRELSGIAWLSAQTIQVAKDYAPAAGTVGLLGVASVIVQRAGTDQGTAD